MAEESSESFAKQPKRFQSKNPDEVAVSKKKKKKMQREREIERERERGVTKKRRRLMQ